jgi:hypothetical protein
MDYSSISQRFLRVRGHFEAESIVYAVCEVKGSDHSDCDFAGWNSAEINHLCVVGIVSAGKEAPAHEEQGLVAVLWHGWVKELIAN